MAGRAAWAPLVAAGVLNLEQMVGTRGPPGAVPDLGSLTGLVQDLGIVVLCRIVVSSCLVELVLSCRRNVGSETDILYPLNGI